MSKPQQHPIVYAAIATPRGAVGYPVAPEWNHVTSKFLKSTLQMMRGFAYKEYVFAMLHSSGMSFLFLLRKTSRQLLL